jgi:polyisoprenoid-binding protein YceI
LFDAEGRRRFDATHYPRIEATLAAAIPLGDGRHRVRWRMTFHGTTRDLVGDLVVRELDANSLAVEAEQRFDVRHWGVEPGSVLAIRVRPEATFVVRLIARRRVGRRALAL